MGKYKDKQWLEHQYKTLGKSYDTIAKENGIGKTTVARYVKRYGLKTDEDHHFRGKYRDREKSVIIQCAYCGEDTKKKPANLKRGGNYGKFCSTSCATRFQVETTDLTERVKKGYQAFLATEEGRKKHRENSLKGLIAAMSGKRTSIEVKMAEELERRGIDYIEQYILGEKFALDFFLPGYNIVIECDGDYWHTRPEAIRRDKSKNAYVKACGFSLYRFWESEINGDVEACVDIVMAEINERRDFA